MGAYTNPEQDQVYKQYGQQTAKLQSDITQGFGMAAQGYATKLKERKKENEKKELENKRTLDGINKSVSKLQTSLSISDNKYKKVDWATVYNPLIQEFEDLSKAIEFGTSSDPSADRKRRDQITASVAGITNSVTNFDSYIAGMDKKLQAAGKQGGIYEGMDSSLFKGLSIFGQKLPGSRQPRFVDGDMDKLVWDVFDEEGALVQTFDAAKLERITAGLDELVIIIPDSTEYDKKIQTNLESTIFNNETKPGGGVGHDGKNPINKSFIQYGPKIGVPGMSSELYYSEQEGKVNKFGSGGMMFDPSFSADINGFSAEIIGAQPNNTGAIAYQNSQFKDVKYTMDDFINDPMLQKPDPKNPGEMISIYNKENIKENDPVGGEVWAAINDAEGDGVPGVQFDLADPLTKQEKDIFQVGYKKNYLTTQVQNTVDPIKSSTPRARAESNQFNNYVETNYGGNSKFSKKGVFNASAAFKAMQNDPQIDSSKFTGFEIPTKARIDSLKKAVEADYIEVLRKNNNLATTNGEPKLEKAQADDLLSRQNAAIGKYEKAVTDNKIWDKKNKTALTFDQFKTNFKQTKLIPDRNTPPINVEDDVDEEEVDVEETVVEETVETPPNGITPPGLTEPERKLRKEYNLPDGALDFNKIPFQKRKQIQKEFNPDWKVFKRNTDVDNTIEEFEKWFNSGMPSGDGEEYKGFVPR